ncbi:MAG: hypothetical protein P8P74_10715 [Crocinitomicaceae bacterium]|nr:hypothetical protein [Crocinitomicaceae bacterium]
MDLLEKHRFGVVAVIAAYVVIFAYFQVGTYDGPGVPYSPFHEGPELEIPEDEIALQPENIMLPSNFDPSNIKNTARDENDKRARSEENYSVSEYTGNGGIQDATEYEKRMFEEAGGAAEREKIRAQIEARKQREKEQAQNNATNDQNSSTQGTNNAVAGNVMVSFNVPKHTAHQGNDYYVRNPGYKCGVGASGRVMILVKVDQSGKVLSATYDPSQSDNATYCMITEAKKYALISRFNYAADAAKSQSGWISYTFISQ